MAEILFDQLVDFGQGSSNLAQCIIDDRFVCTLEREYVTEPHFFGTGSYSSYGETVYFNSNDLPVTTLRELTEYDYILQRSRGDFNCSYTYGMQGVAVTYNVARGSESSINKRSMNFPDSVLFGFGGTNPVFVGTYSTNIPIFLYEDLGWATIYGDKTKTLDQRNEALTHALNYSSGKYVDEDLKEYVYYGKAEQYTVDEFGNYVLTDAPALYRGIRIKSRERCTLYEIEGIDDGILKMGMNFQGVEIAYYSDDFGETWQQMAGQPTQIPFAYLYRNWLGEVGTFYALSMDRNAKYPTNMFVFKTKEESDEYNDGGDNEEDATNYGDISTGYTPENKTGEEDEETTFGTIGIRSIFSQQYIMSETALSEVANAFYDVSQGGTAGIFEDIKKGCEMYGDTVVDDIESLVFYPVNLNTVFSSGIISQNYIYFGGYRFAMQNSVNRILFPNGFYDFGTFTIETTFGDNIRSYEPYTKLYCYLAYIGWVQLDMKKYLHKSVNIRYYIDTRANTCCAVLIANGVMCDFFNGQIGVSMPLRATDMNAYANAQIQALLGLGSGVGGRMSDAQKVGSQLAQAGATAGETIAGAGALGVLGVGMQGTKTLYGLTQNNINNFNHAIGGSSSIINMMLPQECLFMFEVQEAMPTEYERELVGLPSNASGTVGSFSGYLECEQVNLVCSGATAKEQAEIIRYLYNGVYI